MPPIAKSQEHERTIARMHERFNELTAKWESATAESALNAAQRDDARAAIDDRRKGRDEARASAMAELNCHSIGNQQHRVHTPT